MKSDRQITALQAASVIASTIVGVGILPLPLFAARAGGSGAPLVTLIGVLIGFIGILLLAILGKRFPRQTLIQYSREVIGKWPSWIINVIVIVFFSILTAFAAREFGEVVITSVLKNTPVEVSVIVMLLLSALSCRQDITTFAYIHYFYLPFILIPAWLIVFLSLKNAEVINLFPLWGNAPRHLLKGGLSIANLFQATFVLSCVIPAMRHPSKAMKACIWGTILAGILFVSIAAAAIAVFGAEEIKNLLWPTLELAKTTSLPANVLERLDAAFLAVWVTAVFTTLYSCYTLTITSIADLLKIKDFRMLPMFLLPLIFILAMQPKSIIQLYTTIHYIGQLGLVLTIGYPAVLLLIAMIRGKRSDRNHEKTTLDPTGNPSRPTSN